MYIYANLNSENICFGLVTSTIESDSPNLIQIPEYDDDYMYRKYENGKWSEEKYFPEVDEQEFIDPLDSLGQLSVQQTLKLTQLETKLDTLGQAVTQLLLK